MFSLFTISIYIRAKLTVYLWWYFSNQRNPSAATTNTSRVWKEFS